MADKIRTDTDRLGTDAADIQRYIQNIADEANNMKSSVAELERMWEGPSSRAFHIAFQDDMRAVETVIKNLKSIYAYGTNAKKEYESCERKVATMIAEIKV